MEFPALYSGPLLTLCFKYSGVHVSPSLPVHPLVARPPGIPKVVFCPVTLLCSLLSFWATSDSSQPHGLQHARLPWSSPSPRVCSNSCPLSWRCHPTISFFAAPFSFCQFFPASRSFPMSHSFVSGDQSIGASASALPVNIHGCFLLGLTDLISYCPGNS